MASWVGCGDAGEAGSAKSWTLVALGDAMLRALIAYVPVADEDVLMQLIS
jgi:hypothetical protein